MRQSFAFVVVAALTMLAACSLPARTTSLASRSGYEAPATGSLIGGGDTPEHIGSNGDPSFYMPQNGPGNAGGIPPRISR